MAQKQDSLKNTLVLFLVGSLIARLGRGNRGDAKARTFAANPDSCHFGSNFTDLELLLSSETPTQERVGDTQILKVMTQM